MPKDLERKLIIILVALVLLLGIAAVYVGFTILSPKEEATTKDNTQIAADKPSDKTAKGSKKTSEKGKKGSKDKADDKDKKAADKGSKDKVDDKDKKAADEGSKDKTDDKKAADEESKDKVDDDKKASDEESKDKVDDDKKASDEESKDKVDEDKKASDEESKETVEEVTEEVTVTEDQTTSAAGIVNLASLAKTFLSKEQKKDKTPKGPLDEMPKRKKIINNPFAFKKEIMEVEESDFKNLQEQSIASAGKFNPFSKSAFGPTVDNPENQSQDIPMPPNPNFDQIVPPPGVSNVPPELPTFDVIPGPPTMTDGGQQDVGQQIKPANTNVNTGEDLLSSTYLSGVIGDAAILRFGNESRALHVGQNYKGIVVLSVSDKSVLLESNGVQVIRELRDRF